MYECTTLLETTPLGRRREGFINIDQDLGVQTDTERQPALAPGASGRTGFAQGHWSSNRRAKNGLLPAESPPSHLGLELKTPCNFLSPFLGTCLPSFHSPVYPKTWHCYKILKMYLFLHVAWLNLSAGW